MSKKSNPNTIKNNGPKTRRDPTREISPWIEDYEDFFLHRSHPVTQNFLDHLGQELLAYVENEKTQILRIEWFFIQKRIPPRAARRWAEANEKFKETYETAKFILGMRRENGGLRKQFDSGLVSFTMPHYDPTWKELAEWKAKLKSDAEQEQVPTTVIFKKFE
jgi:hypothetical protein